MGVHAAVHKLSVCMPGQSHSAPACLRLVTEQVRCGIGQVSACSLTLTAQRFGLQVAALTKDKKALEQRCSELGSELEASQAQVEQLQAGAAQAAAEARQAQEGLQAQLAALQEARAALAKEAQRNLAYQQELEGALCMLSMPLDGVRFSVGTSWHPCAKGTTMAVLLYQQSL